MPLPPYCIQFRIRILSGPADALDQKSPYVAAYIAEHQGAPAGYGLVSLTYSNEAGGLVVWLEELYIRDFAVVLDSARS